MPKKKDVHVTAGEAKVLLHLDSVGYDHTTTMQMRFNVGRHRIHQILTNLWHNGLISREITGVAISLLWLKEHRAEKKRLEKQFNVTLV